MRKASPLIRAAVLVTCAFAAGWICATAIIFGYVAVQASRRHNALRTVLEGAAP